jgi:hypothetical protein
LKERIDTTLNQPTLSILNAPTTMIKPRKD